MATVDEPNPMHSLTKRESEILACIQTGMLSKQIASQLNISKRTVDVFRRGILKKFNAKTIAEVISIRKEYFSDKQ
jgi:FixJ family two-component response regulator